MTLAKKVIIGTGDALSAPFLALGGAFLKFSARFNANLRASRFVLDKLGVAVLPHHYYTPVVFEDDIDVGLLTERTLPGLDLNEAQQLELVSQFKYRDELLAIPRIATRPDQYGFNNPSFKSGDAEFLYDFVRHFKPHRIVEVGSGQSSLIIEMALKQNKSEDSKYNCEHICIEPYEQPWLEKLGIQIIRKKVQDVDTSLFTKLEKNDILFIDSSHMIRPQGDVVYQYLHILPLLIDGVVIHAHDVFTPNDYLKEWIVDERRLWNEQYLLEALLTGGNRFEVLAAVNWLTHHHSDKLGDAAPVLLSEPGREPGSFWFRSRAPR